ncbi:putative uncharacterized protein [Tetragenococcus halophilus subsp. halophilus]|uniref:DUF2179 domain-containing protein n=1 Tax=Tetragenococcus halophilus (strain DSM 20338 / JCM 20259 / NCIMB 9735 / NBRC 12172) TaxID=945021 RepID=A0AAN1SG35_TETHN|nr:YitT family protein [Tetragenococcus halophilus]MCO8294129.1 YitT family protein [Tetragenococcus halophilus]RQD32502.1 YitT family protein [Tetragenococcus halophilus subsp. halophilus DSM 20339]BAK94418.1 hypothetical protein TEH_10910 [Tetragenococcus halophilus NBRC 12172]GBD59256.1 putative uncharacterized protein [Tetragenococcus halophilus subsp. halophilus]GBD60542.1 putative uncharacterized protein [Tetragenococcus halophilus subsp. halophilus]
MKLRMKNLLMMVIGAFMYGIAVNWFLLPHEIGDGGVVGLAAIGYYALGIPPDISNIVLNALLLLLGYRLLDKKIIFNSLWAVIWISVFLRLPNFLDYTTDQTIIPATVAGLLMGFGLFLIFNAGGTIAGSTVLGEIGNRYLGMKRGNAMLIFDLAVAIPSGFIIGFENMLLTVVELYTCAMFLNKLRSFFGAKKSVTIITNKTEEVTGALSNTLKQGITLINSTGYYHKQSREMIYLICSDKQVANIFPLISNIDKNAFVVVDDVHSVKGEELPRIL